MSIPARWAPPIGLAVAMCAFGSVNCVAQPTRPNDLTQLSLEDLLNVRVTSVSKREQKLSKAGAAIYVITQDDIRRSGATNLPDLLRMAPGVNVAQMDSNSWAISIRGFNDLYADKVLVLIDGRSVYNPLFSGVSWDAQDVVMEDIERIEVIRGPGGTVWGANAMNGVINVITRKAGETQGGLMTGSAGSAARAEGVTQYGGKFGSRGTYRVFAKHFNIGDAVLPDGSRGADGWNATHGGFRSDWNLSSRDAVTVQGDLQAAQESQTISTLFSNALPTLHTFNDRFHTFGGNILGRWSHTLSNGSQTSLQVYDDNSHRRNLGVYGQQNTVNLDFQHHVSVGSRQDIVWGVGARVSNLLMRPGYSTTFSKLKRADTLFSAFMQDEVRIAESVWLTMGSKFERNNYTGFEFEPSAQLIWTPTNRQSMWLSAARAIQQPNAFEFTLHADLAAYPAPGVPFALLVLSGNPASRAETLKDLEAGYRAQIGQRLSVDLAAFASSYRSLRSFDQQTPYFATDPQPPHLVLPALAGNNGHGNTYGGEIFANWAVTNRWRISPGYSRLQMVLVRKPSSLDIQPEMIPGSVPAQQFHVRSSVTLTRSLEWDASLSHVGHLDYGGIPAYTRADARLAWHLGESFEFSLVGQNLLKSRHAEHPDEVTSHTLIERAVFVRVTWRF